MDIHTQFLRCPHQITTNKCLYLPEQVLELKNQPSMAVETIVKGLEVALSAIILNDKDEKRIGGSIC